jgi:hypothetical protein
MDNSKTAKWFNSRSGCVGIVRVVNESKETWTAYIGTAESFENRLSTVTNIIDNWCPIDENMARVVFPEFSKKFIGQYDGKGVKCSSDIQHSAFPIIKRSRSE